MASSSEIQRIQNYLRESARGHYESLALPPFTLFFHPIGPLKYFNYAIPDDACRGVGSEVFAALRSVFQQRKRTARFEFFEVFAPELPAALRANGFIEEARQWAMVCTPQSLRPIPAIPGLEIITLNAESDEQEVRDYLLTQQEGFSPEEISTPTAEEIRRTLASFQRWQGYLGRVDGEPVGIAGFARPIQGITEIAGIATRIPFRRRGIAAVLTSYAVRAAFEQGVQTACLTAADERAGRVYERVGFTPFSIMLAYIDM